MLLTYRHAAYNLVVACLISVHITYMTYYLFHKINYVPSHYFSTIVNFVLTIESVTYQNS